MVIELVDISTYLIYDQKAMGSRVCGKIGLLVTDTSPLIPMGTVITMIRLVPEPWVKSVLSGNADMYTVVLFNLVKLLALLIGSFPVIFDPR